MICSYIERASVDEMFNGIQRLIIAFQKDELLEISSRRVQQPPASIILPDCFGFLFKLGARWHQWKRRYCVLKDASLFLYHEAEAQQAIGMLFK